MTEVTDIFTVISTLCVVYLALRGVTYLLATYTDIGRDATDPPKGRSDMKIMTDHQTGCQYLMGSRGGLTPRLDENGKHMCEKKGSAA